MESRISVQHIRPASRWGRQPTIPAWVIDSGVDGPCLLITAGQHGNEVQGPEAIRRFVRLAATRLVAGRIVAVPFLNIAALHERRPHVGMGPEQAYENDGGLNMNRAWPGRADGSETEQVAHAVYRAFGEEATHVLDIHAWHKHAAPAVLLPNLPDVRALALRLGHRFVEVRPLSDRTLSGYFCSTGRIGLTYECAGQYAVDEEQVCLALRFMTNLAVVTGLFPEAALARDEPVLFSDAVDRIKVTAPLPGLFVKAALPLGGEVDAGQPLGHILSEQDLETAVLTSPATGYLQTFGVSRPGCDVAMPGHHPFVSKGDLLAVVASPTSR